MVTLSTGSNSLALLNVDEKILEFYNAYAFSWNFSGIDTLLNYYQTCYFLRATIVYFLYRTIKEDRDCSLLVDIAEKFPMFRQRVFEEINQRGNADGLRDFVLRFPEFK